MDGIALELWNKKLLLCRYQRQGEFKARAELAHSSRAYSIEPLPALLFQAAADNMDIMVLYWKETFQGSWQREKPENPALTAAQAQSEIQAFLGAEQKQIEHEIEALGSSRGLGWKPEELDGGKSHLNTKISQLRAGVRAQIAEAQRAREDELEREAQRHTRHRKELLQTRLITLVWVVGGTLFGVKLGAYLNARQSSADREYVDVRMKALMDNQRQMQQQLGELHRSNRKIAFWTEKTPEQIDQEMAEAKDDLARQIADINEEIARRTARVESEYARSGRDGGSELNLRKQGLANLQAKMIGSAEEKTRKKLADLDSQKRNSMR
jgi:hypothetical protein